MSTLLNIGIVLSATNLLSPALQSATGDLNTLDNKVSEFGQNLTAISTASLALGQSILNPLKSAYGDSQALKQAQGEIKTLGIMGEDLQKITYEANKFTTQFANTSASEFVSASYDIKSGISSLSATAVGKFTAMSAITGAATKSTTAEMTNLFATGFGIYRKQFDAFGEATIKGWNNLSDEEKDIKFGEYFSAGIASTVQEYKTTGSNMSAAMSNLGAVATSANVPFAEQLSILGMLQKTMSGSEASTKYRAFLNSAYGAGDKLGLTFTDANDQLLSMPEILSTLKDKYGETLDAIESDELKKAFGTDEAVALVKMLYSETDSLTSNIDKMNLSLQEGATKTKQMAMAANYGKDLELYDQRVNRLSTSLGNSFAPVMSTVLDIVGNGAVIVSDFMNEHETLSTVIVGTIGVAGGLLTVLGGLGIVVGGAATVMPFLAGGLGLVGTGFGVVTAATKAMTIAMATNPIGLIATGIAGAAYLIYSNWEPISTFFSDLWGGIKENAAPVLDYLNTGLSAVSSFFGFNDTPTSNVDRMQKEVMSTGVQSSNSMIYENRKESSSKVVHNEPTYHITVANPNSNVDVVKAMQEHERNRRNRQYEDID